MALQQQPVRINFQSGINTKTDPFQLPVGQFLGLNNSVFTKQGLLQKRNGFGALTALPDTTTTFLTTFNNDLLAIGNKIEALSRGTTQWTDKGPIIPISLATTPLLRTNNNQTAVTSAIAPNGLALTAYTETISGSPVYKYIVSDSATGQIIVGATVITPSSGTVAAQPLVYVLGQQFILLLTVNVSGVYHVEYLPVSIANPTIVGSYTNISLAYTPGTKPALDGVIANNRLYIAWNGNDGGGALRITSLNTSLAQSNTVVFTGHSSTIVSICADITQSTPIIWVLYYGSTNAYAVAVSGTNLTTILDQTQIISGETSTNITAVVSNMMMTFYYEITNAYSYDSGIPTNYLKINTLTQSGTLGSATVFLRSVGLASKAILNGSDTYMLTAYSSGYQPTNFLVNGSAQVVAKLSYGNCGGYIGASAPLPNPTLASGVIIIPYLYKDLIAAANKTQGASVAGIYSQLGSNLAAFTLSESVDTAEIGTNLHLSGGFMWMYDGTIPVEHGFHLWPDSVEATWSATGGSIAAKPDGSTNTNAYFYQAVYTWMDNQGNIHRSAPSVPVAVTTTGSGTSGSITVNIPTLRLTYKTVSPVQIVLFRWSVGQQIYYQVTSMTAPLLNDTTVDSVQFVDTLADASILGNSIIYTAGGVLENIAAPATDIIALWQSRLALLDSEDKNLIWLSKQVIEKVPVEMSDLITLYVAPTTGAQGSTGPSRCLAPMDEKLIVFKDSSAYYFTGAGPDNTGNNSQIGDATFITSSVGCSNQRSIVLMQDGLMFQSSKGIWLLGRDLSTQYIGAPVESFTQNAIVLSAVSVPSTNQVRFTLDSGITLMYDYFYKQWGVFLNIPALSSTLYESLHTYVDSRGNVFQETPGSYLDGSQPVLMSFTTAWFQLGGIQGYQRAYEMYLLATYLSPHKLQVGIAYDFNSSIQQSTIIQPDNFAGTYGSSPLYGDDQYYGGQPNLEQWRVFFAKQRCQAFQLTINEIYDSSIGAAPGPGFTMSGINAIVGISKGKPLLKSKRYAG